MHLSFNILFIKHSQSLIQNSKKKTDPPHISNDEVILNSNELNGLPELLVTDYNSPIYRVKANTTVMMGKFYF